MNKAQFINKLDKLISPSHEEYNSLKAKDAIDFYLVSDCSFLIHPIFKNIISVIRFTYRFIPLIAVAILAYAKSDSLLLFCIPASYLGSLTAKHNFYMIPILYLLFCTWVWIDRGFANSYHVNLPLICMAAGFVFYRQAHAIINREVGRLINDSEKIYNILLERKTLLIFKKK